MEDILYEYHLAQGITTGYYSGGSATDEITYREAIFRKHNITAADFDSSMVYYCRHADKLYDIYQHVQQRLQNDVVANGGDIAMQDDGFAATDTTNIWNKETSGILFQIAPFNVISYSIKADTTFYAGDKFTLAFDVQYIFQDGMRDFIAMLSITLNNDSVISANTRISQDGHASISVSDDKQLGIKSVNGYIMLGNTLREEPTTALRLVSIRNIRLSRLHSKQEPLTPPTQNEENDTLISVEPSDEPLRMVSN